MIVKSDYFPLFNDFENNGNIKIEKVLEFFENSGGIHSDLVGNSISKMLENGKSWVLNEWNIEILKYPKNGESKFEVKTWILPQQSPLYSIREYELCAQNEVYIKGSSKWILFDLVSQKICKIDKSLIDMYEPESVDTKFEAKKIEIPQNFDTKTAINVRKSDIDINNHVHNTLYLHFAYEVLPDEIYKNMNFSKIRISYKNSIKFGEKIICKYAKAINSHIVAIYDDNDSLKAILEFV